MDDSGHYTDETTRNGVHDCDSADCMTAGLSMADLRHLAFALHVAAPVLDGTDVKTTLFRDETGLYCLLTVPYGDNRAVIEALYTPGLLAELRNRGYTLTLAEADGGVN